MDHDGNLGAPIPIMREDLQPVFVVGMNGSGTSMLLDSLGRHPDLYAFPLETKIIPFLIASINEFGDLGLDENFLRLWRHVCTGLHLRPRVPVPSNWKEFPRDLASVLDAVFRYFAAKEGKTRWCEKTPQHIQHLLSLHSLFPQARFVHVIRDGRDCAASMNWRFKRTPEYTIFRWKNVVRQGREQGALLGDKYFEIKYEAVTEDPEFQMRQICEFLGLPFHRNILLSRYPGTERAGKRGEVKGGLEPNSGKWRTYFSQTQLARLEEIAGACLAELNYPIQYTSGDANPTKLKLVYWQWWDYSREFLNLVFKDLRLKRRIRWSENLRRIRTALRQSRVNRY